MTDLHIHILPGLDDGAADLSESIAMARLAASDGIRRVIATPHSYGERGFYEALPHEIRGGVTQLQGELTAAGIDLQVAVGMEVLLSAETLEYLRRGWLLPLADSDCLLCEFAGEDGAAMTELLAEVEACGYRPMIAHAERYASLWKRSSPARDWVRRGWYLQVNASHLTEMPHSFVQRHSARGQMIRTAWQLIEDGLVYAVATDSHSPTSRPPILSAAWDAIAARIDPDTAEKLCRVNPSLLWKGNPHE